ncbi:MAG: amino acid adenylation domain-containing protein, partial [Stenotrophomonas indicatrix]|uniref:amino acid adenylation domain-containing protein n=1 Tax=Stenotrophomonas indicatrix TaxID=2045451 RepID=UPI003D0B8D89
MSDAQSAGFDDGAGFELSPQQRRAWNQRNRQASYVRGSLVLHGALDRSRLQECLTHVSERHEILRTRFHSLPSVVLPLQVVDQAGLLLSPETHAAATLADALRQHIPCVLVCSESPDLHAVHLCLDSMRADMSTMRLLLEELAAAYNDQASAEQGEPMQYADVAQWLNELAEGSPATAHYWSGIDLDRYRAPMVYGCRLVLRSEAAAERVEARMTDRQRATLDELASQWRTTPADALFALWTALLACHADADAMLCGRELDGRAIADLAGTLGPLAQVMPLAVDCPPSASLSSLSSQLSALCTIATAQQEYFAAGEALRASDPAWPGQLEALPVYRWLDLPSARPAPDTLCDARVVEDHPSAGVRLNAFDHGHCLCLQVEANAGLPQGSGALLLSQLLVAVDAGAMGRLTDVASVAAASIPDVTPESASVHPEAMSPCASGVPERILRHTIDSPQAVAVHDAQGEMTYGELLQRSQAVAVRLQNAGVGVEDRVAILLERSRDTVVAMLGAWLAGAAFVPVDPQFGSARKRWILEDAAAACVLTSRTAMNASADDLGNRVCIVLEEVEEGIETHAAMPTPRLADPDQIAYLIYTSGSTGRPKGVAVSHRSLDNYVTGVEARLQLPADAVCSFFSTVAADLGYTTLFAALCHGRRLFLAPDAASLDGEWLAQHLPAARVDAIKLVPSHFEGLLNLADASALIPADCLVFGGEQLSRELVERIWAVAPTCRIFNHYGPTESTVGVLATRIEPSLLLEAARLPLGTALDNSVVRILDDALRPVPVGGVGELFIGGPGLARGYWQQPAMTAERFIPDPHAGSAGNRLYRSGDRVRQRPDGRIEFLGRTDDQVKLRGYRIEPSEIAATLGEQPGVADCRVLVKDEGIEGGSLWAFIVPGERALFDLDGMATRLASHLPGYMIPSHYVLVDRFPYLPNGKVDRATLLAMAPAHLAQSQAIPPRDATERGLLTIWGELLGRDDLGIEHDFFRAGGHSLLATQLVARVRDTFAVDISVRDLFTHATIASLAARIAEALPVAADARPAPLASSVLRASGTGSASAAEARRPLSFAQQRLWLLDQLIGMDPTYNIRHIVQLRGELEVVTLRSAFERVTHRHHILRTRFLSEAGVPYQQVVEDAPLDFQLQETADADTLAAALAEASSTPFALDRLPLIRVRLFRCSAQEHVLAVVCHHIVSDGWSTGILAAELAEAYRAGLEDREPTLAALPIQYADYAQWQRTQFSEGRLDHQVAYWRRQLDDAPPVLALPLDAPRGAVLDNRAGMVRLDLPVALTQALAGFCDTHRCTPYMVFLAALQVLLARQCGQQDVSIGSPVGNRQAAELQGLIGFFVNTLVMRGNVDERLTVAEWLSQVRDRTLDAYEHQDVPFEHLVEILNPERSLAQTPLFQVMLTLQTLGEADFALGPVRAEVLIPAAETVKFDLEFSIMISPDSIEGALLYRSTLFQPASASRLAEGLVKLLQDMVAHPQQRLLEVANAPLAQAMSAGAEGGAALHGGAPLPTLLEAFQTRANLQPLALALRWQDQVMTYAELDRRSDLLAAWLHERGVEAGDLVGVCLARTPSLPIALLAIHKQGAAYVPIDPAYPQERIAYLRSDARLKVTITDADSDEGGMLALEHLDWDAPFDKAAPAARVPDALAYVIYTSGTTGNPKGVMVTQSGLASYLRWARQAYPLAPGKQVPVNSSVSFDATVTSLLLPLTAGATVVLLPEVGELDALAALLSTDPEVGLVKLTPAHLEVLRTLQCSIAGRPTLVVGGEELAATTAAYWAEQASQAAIVNEYGPTETVVGCCVHRLGDDDAAYARVPIGRPIDGTRLYVLDDHLRPVAQGAVGELFIGGQGVARGYLGRPALSAERFVPDPFSRAGGERLYRTGDRVRLNNTGQLEYFGRGDHQIKLRGFRIELGEVEAALGRLPGVQEAV